MLFLHKPAHGRGFFPARRPPRRRGAPLPGRPPRQKDALSAPKAPNPKGPPAQDPQKQWTKPDRLVRQAKIQRPALFESPANGLKQGPKPLLPILRIGNSEGNSRLTDLPLRPHKALADRGGQRQKQRRDALRRKPQHSLQHQRRSHAGLKRRMRALKHQPRPFVRNGMVYQARLLFFRQKLKRRLSPGGGLAPPAPPPGRLQLAPYSMMGRTFMTTSSAYGQRTSRRNTSSMSATSRT